MYPPQASFVDDVWISVWYGPLPIGGVTVAVSCVTCVQLYVYVRRVRERAVMYLTLEVWRCV